MGNWDMWERWRKRVHVPHSPVLLVLFPMARNRVPHGLLHTTEKDCQADFPNPNSTKDFFLKRW